MYQWKLGISFTVLPYCTPCRHIWLQTCQRDKGIYDGDGNTGMCHEDTRKSFVRGIQCVSQFSMWTWMSETWIYHILLTIS